MHNKCMRKNIHTFIRIATAVLVSASIFPINIYANTNTIGSISAESAVLYAEERGEFLYQKNAHRRMPIASTTKIMTAYTVLSAKDVNETVVIPKEACGIEGSSIYLEEGERLTILELLEALMLQSANDAAVALAIATDGSIEAFAERMNRLVKEMGLSDTYFTNPHGLDDPDHYSSAYDLALIASKAMENATFRALCKSKVAKIPGKDGGVRVLVNHNKLLRLCDSAVGVKTGFTKKSGRCLVGAAERDGVKLISVTLNAPNDWNDHQNMFSYGFSLYENREIAKKGALTYKATIVGGEKCEVHLTNNEDIFAVLPKEETHIETIPEWNRPIFAPVKAGEVVGTVYFKVDGAVVAESSLVATESINKAVTKGRVNNGRKSKTPKIFSRCRSFFSKGG